jgi:hypothetical protein
MSRADDSGQGPDAVVEAGAKMKILIVVGLFACQLVGCAGGPAWTSMKISSTREEADMNNANLMKAQIGQNREEFLETLGMPAKREAYQLGNDRIVEFLFYRTGGWGPGSTVDTDAQFTPVAIENGKVTGWGRNFYDRVVTAAVDVTIR